MKAERSRPIHEYKGFNNWYLEGCTFESLTPEESLALGMVYNMTGKAKNQRTYIRGAAVNSMTQMANQHKDRYNIKKKVTRTILSNTLDSLIQKMWIHIVRVQHVPTGYGNKTKLHEHIQLTDYGLTMVNKAIRERDNKVTNVNTLF